MLGYSPSRLRADQTLFGALLESFVFSELLKLSAWTEERVMLFHYRDRDQLEVDFVLENSAGEIVGIEVKSAASVTVAISWDWNGWPALLDLHSSWGLFCTMEVKRSHSPRIFALSRYQRYGPDGRVTVVWRFAGQELPLETEK